jgi:glycosyltransferase involved in cell wall biosynthesis
MRVIHLSTKNVKCGIATYTANLVDALNNICSNTYYKLPVWQDSDVMSSVDVDSYYSEFIDACEDHDAIHIQHEHGLFTHTGKIEDSIDRTGQVLESLAKKYPTKKVFITFHTAPEFITTLSQVIFQRSIETAIMYFMSRMWRAYIAKTIKKYSNINAIVHSQITRDKLIASRVPANSINIVPHGVQPMRNHSFSPVDHSSETINLGIFGFIAEYKGHDLAIRAMQYLPERYKLLILGGRHPNNMSTVIEDRLALIEDLALEDRIKITGYIKEDEFQAYNDDISIYLAPYTDPDLSASGAVTWSLTSGKPVVGTFIPAFNNICKEHECIAQVNHISPRELAWKIIQLVESSELQVELVNNCKKYCADNSWSNIAKTHINLYTAVDSCGVRE